VESHEEFLELCAVSTSGELTEEERKKLDAHLAECAACREALKQFEIVAEQALPAVAPEPEMETKETVSRPIPGEDALLRRLERMRKDEPSDSTVPGATSEKKRRFRSRAQTLEFWMPFAAGLILVVALGLVLFRRGSPAYVVAPSKQGTEAFNTDNPADRTREVSDRERIIADLRHQVEVQIAETTRLKTQLKDLETKAQSSETEKIRLSEERDALAQKLQTEEASLARVQQDLEAREHAGSKDDAEVAALEAKIADLSHLADEQGRTVDKQKVLLERDRDIRELMGARDLYIAEVYDVARTGETQKPCGRVFLTKGKSLIFYAFDLDQQPGLTDANSFQAWGRRGPDRAQAFNLGIFYEDNVSKKRWVVKSEDPRTLAQIDAVFVTVEPKGGSMKPSSKPFLFAYLKADANHP